MTFTDGKYFNSNRQVVTIGVIVTIHCIDWPYCMVLSNEEQQPTNELACWQGTTAVV